MATWIEETIYLWAQVFSQNKVHFSLSLGIPLMLSVIGGRCLRDTLCNLFSLRLCNA